MSTEKDLITARGTPPTLIMETTMDVRSKRSVILPVVDVGSGHPLTKRQSDVKIFNFDDHDTELSQFA
jgi:hypothetical protein